MNTKILAGQLMRENEVVKVKKATINIPGRINGKKEYVSLNEDIMSKHSMVVGGTGSGKTNLFYHIVSQIKNKMNENDVMIIFDSKGDYYDRFFTEKDFVISNNKKYREKTRKWNLFREVLVDGWDEKDYILNVYELCNSLFQERLQKNTNNVFFPSAAKDLLSSIIIMMIRLAKENLDFRKQFLYNQELKKFFDTKTIYDIQNLLNGEEDLQAVLSYIYGETEQSQGVISELQSVIREVFVGEFAGKDHLSIRDLVRKKGGRTVFVEYDIATGLVLTPIYRILFDLALKEGLGQTESKGNVYLICDEFKLIPLLTHIEDGVNIGRSKGIKIFAGLQSIEQLYEIYGTSRGKNILAGFSSIYAFKANDSVTRQFITEYYGSNLLYEQFTDFSGKFNTGEKRVGKVIEDWDLTQLRLGEAIVMLPFEKPFKFWFNEY